MKSKWCTAMIYMDNKSQRQMGWLEVNCTDNLNMCLWVFVRRLNCSFCTFIPETSCTSSRKTVTHVICNTHRIHNDRRDIWEQVQGKFLGSTQIKVYRQLLWHDLSTTERHWFVQMMKFNQIKTVRYQAGSFKLICFSKKGKK